MVGDKRILVAYFLHPIGAFPLAGLYLVPVGHERGEVVRGQAVHISFLVHDHGVLLGVEQVGHLIDVLPSDVSIIGDLRLSFVSLLGSDEYHAIGCS